MSYSRIFIIHGVQLVPEDDVKVMIRLDDAAVTAYPLDKDSYHLVEPLLRVMEEASKGIGLCTYTQGDGDGAYFVDLHFRGQHIATLDLLHTTITLYPCIYQSLDSSTEA